MYNNYDPSLKKQDTKYRKSIHVQFWVSCAIYKLVQGVFLFVVSFLQWENWQCFLFYVSLFTLSILCIEGLTSWLQGLLWSLSWKSSNMCGIPSMQGAMNGTHISLVKPQGAFVEDYYYHKIGVSIMAQFVIDCN